MRILKDYSDKLLRIKFYRLLHRNVVHLCVVVEESILKLLEEVLFMKEKFVENGIEYVKNGDYYVPNFNASEEQYRIGKYGMLRRAYLKNHRHAKYSVLLITGELNNHLHDVDVEAGKIIDQFIKSAKKNAPEKTTKQMEWVGYMNNVKKCAEEIIYKKILYI